MELDLSNKNTELATQSDTKGYMTGDWGKEDVSIPRLSLVQAVSNMEEFENGSFVYDRQVQIGKKYETHTVYVLSMHKYYEEDLEYGSDDMPRRWNSEQDARADGAVLKWENGNGARFSPRCDLVLLVPIDLEHAHYEFNGQGYVKCVYTFKSTAYNNAKRIFTATNGKNAGGIPYALTWALSSEQKDNGKNKWYVPVVTNQGATDAKIREWIENEVI